jgi:hypothetical protein
MVRMRKISYKKPMNMPSNPMNEEKENQGSPISIIHSLLLRSLW